ncbi:MAG: GlsB/YeaQ/YmgE family stress response membrane protein [Solirubrobacterales bacterium]
MIGALILGLIAGALGRAVVPNDAFEGMRGPRSWLVSIVLGLVGAALGWAIFTAGLGIGDDDMFDLGGLLSALIGVVIVLLLANLLLKRGGGHTAAPRRG